MASRNPVINRYIDDAINNNPSRDEKLRETMAPEKYQQLMYDRERATIEYLERIRQGEIETRIELQNEVYTGFGTCFHLLR